MTEKKESYPVKVSDRPLDRDSGAAVAPYSRRRASAHLSMAGGSRSPINASSSAGRRTMSLSVPVYRLKALDPSLIQ